MQELGRVLVGLGCLAVVLGAALMLYGGTQLLPASGAGAAIVLLELESTWNKDHLTIAIAAALSGIGLFAAFELRTWAEELARTPSDREAYGTKARELALRTGAIAVRGGMSETNALKAITLNAAKLLHLDHRLGSLEKGKDADFAILSGKPFSVYTHVRETWIDGKKVFDAKTDRPYQEGGFALPAGEKPPKPYALIYGTVFGPDGFTVYGVRIKIRSVNEKKPRWELYSDHGGEFAQRVPAGQVDYVIWADLKGFKLPDGKKLHAGQEVTVHIQNDERADISLHLK